MITHLGQWNGQKLFESLFCLKNNDSTEIRNLTLVPSTSHDHIKHTFQNAWQTMKEFNHPTPEFVYSDRCCGNAGDKAFIEKYWPSLAQDIAKPNLLPLPDDENVVYVHGATGINVTCQGILNTIQNHNAKLLETGQKVIVGLDTEWKWDYSRQERITVLQIAITSTYYSKGSKSWNYLYIVSYFFSQIRLCFCLSMG
jgi:hypothetical protein